MKIAFFASEANPFCKTGGLADVTYALADELSKKGHEVIIALPYYAKIAFKSLLPKRIGSYDVRLSWRHQEAEIYFLKQGKLKFYFIRNQYYFNRDNIYGYHDDGERFAFFALACHALLPFLSFKADIIHCHDWQTGMIPCLIKEEESKRLFYNKTKSVFTIHNPAFKGNLDRFFVNDFFNLSDRLYDEGILRLDYAFSTLKAGIVYSDYVTTVSPTHRLELLAANSEFGLAGVLQMRGPRFVGIVNGIDIHEWDPKKDKNIASNFSSSDWLVGKSVNRRALLDAFHLKDTGGPIYGIVSRLSYQKGIGIIISSMNRALLEGAMLVVLGSGEYGLEQDLEALRARYPSSCGIYIGYNGSLAHQIYAGSDFFLMPSLFEPCGISQMIAKRYGTLPIVRYTGGLYDTVNGYYGENANEADGIGFNDYNEDGLNYAIGVAKRIYDDKDLLKKIALNAMKADHSWAKSANEYEKLYLELNKEK